MNVVTIPKSEYKKLQKEQKYLRSEVFELKKMVQKVANEEFAQIVINRLEKRSRKIDQGGGIKFSSAEKVKKYLRQI